jgi:hypothetical protein
MHSRRIAILSIFATRGNSLIAKARAGRLSPGRRAPFPERGGGAPLGGEGAPNGLGPLRPWWPLRLL